MQIYFKGVNNMSNNSGGSIIDRIKALEHEIYNNKQKIKKLKQENEQLSNVINKLKSLHNDLNDNRNRILNSLKQLPNLIFNPLAILKMDFFSSLIHVAQGPQYIAASNGIKAANKKVVDEYNKNVEEINRLKAKIKRDQTTLDDLKYEQRYYSS